MRCQIVAEDLRILSRVRIVEHMARLPRVILRLKREERRVREGSMLREDAQVDWRVGIMRRAGVVSVDAVLVDACCRIHRREDPFEAAVVRARPSLPRAPGV